MANAGLCSRRDAEKWIEAGRVRVDGELVLTPATVVTSSHKIVVDGVLLGQPSRPRLWGYYKPTGVITTHKDPQGRPTVFDQLPKKLPRLVSIGRLDLNSEGLLLLTSDTQIARYAELPSTGWPRCYRVRVYGDLPIDALNDLKNGIEVEGVNYGRIDVEISRETGRNSWLLITLYEGKNREIRRVLQHLGLHVNRLIRVGYGPFSLDQHKVGELWEIPFSQFANNFPHLKLSEGPEKKTRDKEPKRSFGDRRDRKLTKPKETRDNRDKKKDAHNRRKV